MKGSRTAGCCATESGIAAWLVPPAHLLQGMLSHSGRTRGVFAESQDQAHLDQAIDCVLRRLEPNRPALPLRPQAWLSAGYRRGDRVIERVAVDRLRAS